jgi:uncharacterized phage infection (PIP) family protein YhgE
LAGAVALVGLSSPALAQGGGPNCNACFDNVRSDVAAVSQQVSGVQAGVTQSQQSLVQVQQGVTAVGQQVSGVQAGVTQNQQSLGQVQQGITTAGQRIDGVMSRLGNLSSVVARINQNVDTANQTLSQIVANPPATPPPAVPAKKSAVFIEFGSANVKPPPESGTGDAVARAHRAAEKYCKLIGYAFGKATTFEINSPPSGPSIVDQLVCFD